MMCPVGYCQDQTEYFGKKWICIEYALIQNMERQLKHSLLFENASAADAEYLRNRKNRESGSIVSTLKSSAESGFEPLVFGVKFKKQDERYISGKSAVSNLMLKQLFGIKGSLGSPIIYSTNNASETQVKTLYLKYHGDDGQKQLTFFFFPIMERVGIQPGKTFFTAITARHEFSCRISSSEG